MPGSHDFDFDALIGCLQITTTDGVTVITVQQPLISGERPGDCAYRQLDASGEPVGVSGMSTRGVRAGVLAGGVS